jgi:hypothetical protein
MRTFVGAILSLSSVGCIAGLASVASAAEKPLQVLFIGNSYTFVNDLPGLLSGLAKAARGRGIETGQWTPGGCTFQQHVRNGKAVEMIRKRKWDFVVLQEQSQVPFMAKPLMRQFARPLHEAARKQGAQTVF